MIKTGNQLNHANHVAEFKQFGKIPVVYLKIVLGALALSTVAVVISAKINSLAFDVQPAIGDNAYQYVTSTYRYLDYLYAGRLAAIWNAYLTDKRPLWSILPLMIDPKLLINLNGHIVIGGIFLFGFLSVMGISIYKRTRLVSYAIVCMMAVLSAGNFFHYRFGMGGNYTDLQTAWLIGAALFSLINSEEAQRGRWLVFFGVFSALAQQVRFFSIGVTAVVCAPVLGYYLLRRWQGERTAKSVFVPATQVLIPFLLISGYSLMINIRGYVYDKFVSPMTTGITNMYQPVPVALRLYLDVYDLHLGDIGIGILLFICAIYFLLYWRHRNRSSSLIISFWAAIVFLLTHIFILRIANEWVFTVYMLPGFYLFAFLPFDLVPKNLFEMSPATRTHRVLSISGLIVLPVILFINFQAVAKNVVVVDEFDSQIATYQRDMSAILTRLAQEYYADIQTRQDIPTFDVFVEIRDKASALPVAIDAWYRSQQPIEWVRLYLVWKFRFQTDYPDMSLQEVQAAVYEKVLADLDLVIFLSDPRNEKVIRLSDMYPQQEGDEWRLKINEYVYQRVKEDQLNWYHEPILQDGVYHSPYGDMVVYRNLRRYTTRNNP